MSAVDPAALDVEIRERIAAQVAAADARRDRRRQERADLVERRAAGLRARHARRSPADPPPPSPAAPVAREGFRGRIPDAVRAQVVADRLAGVPRRAVATRYGVAESTVTDLMREVSAHRVDVGLTLCRCGHFWTVHAIGRLRGVVVRTRCTAGESGHGRCGCGRYERADDG